MTELSPNARSVFVVDRMSPDGDRTPLGAYLDLTAAKARVTDDAVRCLLVAGVFSDDPIGRRRAAAHADAMSLMYRTDAEPEDKTPATTVYLTELMEDADAEWTITELPLN